MPLIHFLLVFDLARQELLERREFTDAAEAAAAYAQLEREHHGDQNLEIVLVGADSIETIMTTHRNYFDGIAAASPYLAVVA